MNFLITGVVCCVLYCEAEVLVQKGGSSNGGAVRECGGISCPPGTVHCHTGTGSASGSGGTKLLAVVECRDAHGKVLNSSVKSAAIPPQSGGDIAGNGYFSGGGIYAASSNGGSSSGSISFSS